MQVVGGMGRVHIISLGENKEENEEQYKNIPQFQKQTISYCLIEVELSKNFSTFLS